MTKQLTEAEIKRVLTLAMAQPRAQQGRLTLDELKAGAGELGVPAAKLDDAYAQLVLEQAKAQRGRRLAGAALVGALLVVTGAYVATRPAPAAVAEVRGPFHGVAHVTVTTGIQNDQPVDALTRIPILSMRAFNVFVGLSGLEHLHQMRGDLVDASGNVVESDAVKLLRKEEPYSCWFKFHVPFTRAPGAYVVKTYADDKLIATTPIELVIGNATLATAADAKDGAAIGAKKRFSRAADTQVVGFVQFDRVEGQGANVTFRWTAPDGSVARTITMALLEAHGSWTIWDTLPMSPEVVDGAWQLQVSFEATPMATAAFDIVP